MSSFDTVQNLSSSAVDDEAVRSFLRRQPVARPYHRVEWLRAALDAYGHDFLYLIAEERGGVTGVLPISRFRNLLGQEEFVSLPYCDIGGAVCTRDDVRVQLHQALVELLAESKSDGAELRMQEPVPDGSPVEAGKVCMLLHLPQDPDQLFSTLKAKVRSQIRKAGKNGLHSDISMESRAVADFHSVYCRNMRDLGSPCHSINWFSALKKNFGDDMLIARVWFGRRCIGGAVLLINGSVACVPWASTCRDYNRLAPNMLLYWELLRASIRRGATLFDFGRSSVGEGTFKFKRQWGAQPTRLNWIRLAVDGTSREIQVGHRGPVRRSVESVWKRCPLWLANSVGPRVRGYISL